MVDGPASILLAGSGLGFDKSHVHVTLSQLALNYFTGDDTITGDDTSPPTGEDQKGSGIDLFCRSGSSNARNGSPRSETNRAFFA